MVMKRYPNGIHGKCFFMKRTPSPQPEWLETCAIMHKSANLIAFPMVQDLASLLWVVNLGCIDLNPWYARCDDTDRPDYLHFDLDPGPGVPFARVRETALVVRDALEALGMSAAGEDQRLDGHAPLRADRPRTRCRRTCGGSPRAWPSGSSAGIPKLITAEYRIANRPRGRVLVDYNQNAWGRTLASVYSVRPTERATVSTPGHLARGGARLRDRGLPDRQRARPRAPSWATCGSRSSPPAAGSDWRTSL